MASFERPYQEMTEEFDARRKLRLISREIELFLQESACEITKALHNLQWMIDRLF